ncbi:MAG: AraC family transcriptional regulator [Ruminococcus sp.]|nr:AraC family transcriptional regulator [Ruminococcus sp.]
MDNIIYLGKQFIAGLSDTFTAQPHRHPVVEIYASCCGTSHIAVQEALIEGQIIVVGHNVMHTITDSCKPGIAIFVDPISEFGYSLNESILAGCEYKVTSDCEIKDILGGLSEKSTQQDICSAADVIIDHLQDEFIPRPFSDDVIKAIDLICDEKENFDMTLLAERIHLSKSRLAHIFSEQTGITLKSYLQFKRIEQAFRQMAEGSSITEAAYNTGFSGSSHIASSSRKLLGMQLRKLLNI